jgi:hypothetical protein
MPDHTFETELTSPPPRRVGYRGGAKMGCGLWFIRLFILPHTLVGIGLLCAACWYTGMYAAVSLLGEICDGKIVKKETRKHKSGQTHYAHYVFTSDGNEYAGEVSVNEAGFAQINEGDAITVHALSAWPNQCHWPRVPGHSPLLTIGGVWAATLFWNGILSVFFWGAYLRPLRNRWLIRYGEPTQGIVREVKAYQGKGAASYRITYEYATPPRDGAESQLHTRKITSTSKEAANARAGELVTVLYYPQKPWRSLVYPYSEYRATG